MTDVPCRAAPLTVFRGRIAVWTDGNPQARLFGSPLVALHWLLEERYLDPSDAAIEGFRRITPYQRDTINRLVSDLERQAPPPGSGDAT